MQKILNVYKTVNFYKMLADTFFPDNDSMRIETCRNSQR
jgi:hypothetical protein